jgi:hypothetical protein
LDGQQREILVLVPLGCEVRVVQAIKRRMLTRGTALLMVVAASADAFAPIIMTASSGAAGARIF